MHTPTPHDTAPPARSQKGRVGARKAGHKIPNAATMLSQIPPRTKIHQPRPGTRNVCRPHPSFLRSCTIILKEVWPSTLCVCVLCVFACARLCVCCCVVCVRACVVVCHDGFKCRDGRGGRAGRRESLGHRAFVGGFLRKGNGRKEEGKDGGR